MSKLQVTKTIFIKDDKFELDISKLSVDDFLRIEAYKQILSRNEYFKIATTFLSSAAMAANLTDMISVFRVMSPEIEKATAPKSFEELGLLDSKDLLKVYLKEVSPWYNDWIKEFNQPFEEKSDDDLEDEK